MGSLRRRPSTPSEDPACHDRSTFGQAQLQTLSHGVSPILERTQDDELPWDLAPRASRHRDEDLASAVQLVMRSAAFHRGLDRRRRAVQVELLRAILDGGVDGDRDDVTALVDGLGVTLKARAALPLHPLNDPSRTTARRRIGRPLIEIPRARKIDAPWSRRAAQVVPRGSTAGQSICAVAPPGSPREIEAWNDLTRSRDGGSFRLLAELLDRSFTRLISFSYPVAP